MFAVIETGGQQHAVKEGDVLQVQRLETEAGQEFAFKDVLFVGGIESPKIGEPKVAKAQVLADVLKHTKGRKVRGAKFKKRKGYERRLGHRQPITVVKIKKIEAGA